MDALTKKKKKKSITNTLVQRAALGLVVQSEAMRAVLRPRTP